MTTLFPEGKKVTITGKSPIPVAGSNDDHTGKTGRVRGYTDLAKDDVIHIVDLGHYEEGEWIPDPILMPDTSQPQFDPMTGEKNLAAVHKIHWVEVPASCLSSVTTRATAAGSESSRKTA